MKVTLDKTEIHEAVQHYINNVLGSDLHVTEVSVIQGRESNGARIELELSKFLPPIDLDEPVDLDEVVLTPKQAKADKLPKGYTSEVGSEPEEAIISEISEPAKEKEVAPVTEDHPIQVEAPKSASVMTEGVKPLPGSFFSNN